MENFLGLSRDSAIERREQGSSPFSRNIVKDQKLHSITQENGFNYEYGLKGVNIGSYSTNKHLVFINIDTETSNTIITIVNTDNGIINTILNTSYFNYEVTRPIEIVGWYNSNQELIIAFSDGVFEKSSSPRLINLMDIGVPLTIDKDFTDERSAESTLLFSNVNVPTLDIEYKSKGNHQADVVFYTIAYILPDGITRTRFINVLKGGYPIYAFRSEYKRDLTFIISNLDTFYKQFVIGMVVLKDNALEGYVTNPISFTESTYEYDFTSLDNLNITNPNEITVETSIFEKIKSLTIGNSCIIGAGVTTKSSNLYQKYANNLTLNLYFDERKDDRHQAPLLCPDEVYYFTIALAFKNGQYSDELHIPGPNPVSSDLEFINKETLGLEDLEGDIESFKVINKGQFIDATEGLPNFNNLSETRLSWGYWQNEEKYPNNENYNGTIDYDGTTILTGGRDLRNTNVKLHRVPGLDTLSVKFPMRIGSDIRNEEVVDNDKQNRLPAFSLKVNNFLTAFSTVIERDDIIGYRLSFVKKDGSSKIVEDNNFLKPLMTNKDIEIPEGGTVNIDYTINNTVDEFDSGRPFKFTLFGHSRVKSINLSLYKGSRNPQIVKANFGLFNDSYYSSNVSADYDKSYRDLDDNEDTKGTIGQYANTANTDDKINRIFRIHLPSMKYAVIKSIEQIPGNSKDNENLYLHEQIKLKARNTNVTFPSSIDPVPNYGWNPINYEPTSLSDESQTLVLKSYNPATSSYEDTTYSANDVRRININATFISIKKNIHQGLQPTNFVVIGTTSIDNADYLFKDFGDTFTSNIYNEISESFYTYMEAIVSYKSITYRQQIYSGLLSMDNNTLISFVKDKILGKFYNTMTNVEAAGNDVDLLLSFDYTKQQYNKASTRQLNDIIASTAFNYNKKYINKFPFRIVKSNTIQSENLSTLNVRSFLANAYYDMMSTSGEIISVTGFDRGVYCQQRYSLFIFQLKERLDNNNENSAYLAETDLFAYKPQAIVEEDNKGYIGSVHQFARKLTKIGLITLDAERGKIYIIAGNTPNEISKINLNNEFKDILNDVIKFTVPTLFNDDAVQDNPYNANGVLIGIDDRTNRLLITINHYQPKNVEDPTISFIDNIPYKNGKPLDIKLPLYTENKSKTYSYNTDENRWLCNHDYYPQLYINTNKISFVSTNNYKSSDVVEEDLQHIYSTNRIISKSGKYFYLTDSTIYESYIDLLFNNRYDLSKWFKSFVWRTTVKDTNNQIYYNKTINAVIIYTDYQCTNRIELDTEMFSLIRNSEGLWTFNEFRDMIREAQALPIGKDGLFEVNKVYLSRSWFEMSDFISNFIVIRMIMDNKEDTQIAIHNVNTEFRVSDRD